MEQPRPNIERLIECGANGELSAESYGKFLRWTTQPRSAAEWIKNLRFWLLVVGFSLIISGVLYFGAFNWEELSRFQKFGLLEMLIGAFFAASILRGIDTKVGTVMLCSASILVGGLLAVIGQIYQTGADSFLLFLGWGLLILPWTLVGRSNVLWILQFVLINTTFTLWWDQTISSYSFEHFGVVFLMLNSLLAIVWSLGCRQAGWMWDHICDLLLLAALTPVSLTAFTTMTGWRSDLVSVVMALVSCALLARYRSKSVASAAIVSASLMCMGTGLLIQIFMELDLIGILFVAIGILGQLALVVRWLKRVHQSIPEIASAKPLAQDEKTETTPDFQGIADALEVTIEESRAVYGRNEELPWYAQLLIGTAAWIASLVVLCFFLVWIFDAGFLLLIAGLGLFGTTLALNRTGSGGSFARHALLSAHIAGIMVAMFGVGELSHGVVPAALLGCILLGISTFSYKDNLGQVFFGMGLLGSSTMLLNDLGDWNGLVAVAMTSAIFLTWSGLTQEEFLIGRLAHTWLYTFRGLIAGFLVLICFPLGFEFDHGLRFGLALVITGCIIWTCLRLRHPKMVAITLAAVSILTYTTPTLAAGMLCYLLGFSSRDRLVQAAALATIATGSFFYYYGLHLSLLMKSGVLIASGAIFLGLRLYLRVHSDHQEVQAVAL